MTQSCWVSRRARANRLPWESGCFQLPPLSSVCQLGRRVLRKVAQRSCIKGVLPRPAEPVLWPETTCGRLAAQGSQDRARVLTQRRKQVGEGGTRRQVGVQATCWKSTWSRGSACAAEVSPAGFRFQASSGNTNVAVKFAELLSHNVTITM